MNISKIAPDLGPIENLILNALIQHYHEILDDNKFEYEGASYGMVKHTIDSLIVEGKLEQHSPVSIVEIQSALRNLMIQEYVTITENYRHYDSSPYIRICLSEDYRVI